MTIEEMFDTTVTSLSNKDELMARSASLYFILYREGYKLGRIVTDEMVDRAADAYYSKWTEIQDSGNIQALIRRCMRSALETALGVEE